MFIKEIKDYYKAGAEADIIVSDDELEILCYAQPFSGKYNVDFVLCPLDYSDIMTASKNEYLVEKLNTGFYDYFLRGKLLDVEKGLVQVGGITLQGLRYMPKDIRQGEYIEFSVARIDLIELK